MSNVAVQLKAGNPAVLVVGLEVAGTPRLFLLAHKALVALAVLQEAQAGFAEDSEEDSMVVVDEVGSAAAFKIVAVMAVEEEALDFRIVEVLAAAGAASMATVEAVIVLHRVLRQDQVAAAAVSFLEATVAEAATVVADLLTVMARRAIEVGMIHVVEDDRTMTDHAIVASAVAVVVTAIAVEVEATWNR